jgi:hypothetical protein
MMWPHIDRPMTPVPIQPTRVCPGCALLSAMMSPRAVKAIDLEMELS